MIRGPISLVIVGAISLFMFALVSLGPRAFEGILPASLVEIMENGGMMQTLGDGGALFVTAGRKSAGDTPSDLLFDGRGGLVARGPIAALEGNRPVFIEDVIDGHQTRIAKDIPAEVTTIRPISGCKVTPPLEGTAVGHVSAGSSELDLALLTYNDQTLAGAVQQFVDTYRGLGLGQVGAVSGLAYQSYDVAVTETRRPVYLVLVNSYGHRIWNIHLAPGARVERVVLLGGDQAGVANLDPVVPVEVMSAKGLEDCGVVPTYAANTGTDTGGAMAQAPGAGGDEAEAGAEARRAEREALAAAWGVWFRDSFGVVSDETRAGFDTGMVSVVGPLPGEADPKAVYAPIEGSRIRVTQDKYFEILGQSPKPETFAGRVEAIATSFAFGDLTYLRQGVSF